MSSGAAPQQISAAEVIKLWQNYQMLESEDENELDDGCDEQNEARSVAGRDKVNQIATATSLFCDLIDYECCSGFAIDRTFGKIPTRVRYAQQGTAN